MTSEENEEVVMVQERILLCDLSSFAFKGGVLFSFGDDQNTSFGDVSVCVPGIC